METKETINISSIVETLCSFYTRVVEKEPCLKKILPILKAAIKIWIETCLNKLLLKAVNTNKRRRRVVAANDRMSKLACSITQSFIKQYRRPCCSPIVVLILLSFNFPIECFSALNNILMSSPCRGFVWASAVLPFLEGPGYLKFVRLARPDPSFGIRKEPIISWFVGSKYKSLTISKCFCSNTRLLAE